MFDDMISILDTINEFNGRAGRISVARFGSVIEVHHTYLKSLKVKLKTGSNPNPLFIFIY